MLLKSVAKGNQEIQMTADGYYFWVCWNDVNVPFEEYYKADTYFESLIEQLPYELH